MSQARFPDARILVVDDEPANVRLLERLLERWGYTNIATATDSSTVERLCNEVPPDLLVLDLQMPRPDGFDLMEILSRKAEGLRPPILVVTADITRPTRERALSTGATDFLSKPFDPTEVALRVGNLLDARRAHLELRRHNELLEARVEERTRELERAKLDAVERLALAAEYRDDDTQEHAQRVGRTAALLGLRLGLSGSSVEVIRRAAPLHDIGKIGVPDAILLKPGRLTPEEFDAVKAHTVIGGEILSGSDSHVLCASELIARSHHERWDGMGYPLGLAGDEIPLLGRLTAVADSFDALAHRRPYKEAWPLAEAVAEMRRCSGTQFDPDVVAAFETLDHAALLEPMEGSRRPGDADARLAA